MNWFLARPSLSCAVYEPSSSLDIWSNRISTRPFALSKLILRVCRTHTHAHGSLESHWASCWCKTELKEHAHADGFIMMSESNQTVTGVLEISLSLRMSRRTAALLRGSVCSHRRTFPCSDTSICQPSDFRAITAWEMHKRFSHVHTKISLFCMENNVGNVFFFFLRSKNSSLKQH